MMNRIAIWGAGSLGTILGAYISKAGLDVTLIDAYKEHVDALNEKGAHVIGFTDMVVPVKAAMPENVEGTFDLIIYMAKQTYTETAIPLIVSHCHKDTIICTCQNGIPELAVAKAWPKSQICGAPVGWGATFKGPGVSELTSEVDSMSFHLGSVDGPAYPWIYEVQKVLECMCPTVVSENLMGDRWSKVLINSAFSGMSTVIGGTFGDVMDDPIGVICLARIARETVRACAASGVKMEPFAGVDFAALFNYADGDKEAEAKLTAMIPVAFKAHRSLEASMLQDLQKGRKCEIAQIDGVVAETGDEFGVDTPFVDMVIKIVKEIEDGKRTYCKENLKEFEPLV